MAIASVKEMAPNLDSLMFPQNYREKTQVDFNKPSTSAAAAAAKTQTTVHLEIVRHDEEVSSDSDDGNDRADDGGKAIEGDKADDIDTEEIPIINLHDFLQKVQTKLDTFMNSINTKIEACVKVEFAKTAQMIENVLKKNRAINVSSSLLPATAPMMSAEETPHADQNQGNGLELDLLNEKIATVEAIEKLEQDLALPAKVGQYVCITVI
jgi:hypothetical protein